VHAGGGQSFANEVCEGWRHPRESHLKPVSYPDFGALVQRVAQTLCRTFAGLVVRAADRELRAVELHRLLVTRHDVDAAGDVAIALLDAHHRARRQRRTVLVGLVKRARVLEEVVAAGERPADVQHAVKHVIGRVQTSARLDGLQGSLVVIDGVVKERAGDALSCVGAAEAELQLFAVPVVDGHVGVGAAEVPVERLLLTARQLAREDERVVLRHPVLPGRCQ
jgi:hypothetical protein